MAVFVALVGWGKKVPVQPTPLTPMAQRLLSTPGGPAANLLAAIAFGLVYRALYSAGIHPGLTVSGLVAYLVYAIVFLNLSLFAFQLLPIPGLDGWDVIETLFRSRNARFFFNASVRRREIWVGAGIVISVGSVLGVPLLSILM